MDRELTFQGNHDCVFLKYHCPASWAQLVLVILAYRFRTLLGAWALGTFGAGAFFVVGEGGDWSLHAYRLTGAAAFSR